MRKRDSIEFLWDELKSFLPENYTVDESVKILSILKQAKAMHKEEMDKVAGDFWNEGASYVSDGQRKYNSFEQYYNETYESNT